MFGELSMYVCMVVTSHIWFFSGWNQHNNYSYLFWSLADTASIYLNGWINTVQQPLYLIEFIFCLVFWFHSWQIKTAVWKVVLTINGMYERNACNCTSFNQINIIFFIFIHFSLSQVLYFPSDIICELQKRSLFFSLK